VATDFRLWLREECDRVAITVREVQVALLELAERYQSAAIPGYTHLQKAQPVLFAHWCLAYFEMLTRDHDRLADARKRINFMPLGSAALAGTSYDIDRELVAAELGFSGVTRNSLDAVSDRDFCLEFISACSIIMVHLSRLAEDIIIYSTSEFGFIELGDAIATGSSLMPQKKNPDSMELVRGKAGRVIGHCAGLLATLKGLPLAYNKDMQEDKEAVFDTADTVTGALEVTATVLRNISLNIEKARVAAASGYMNATELADYLVGRGMAFREAHDTVGRIVIKSIELGRELHELPLETMQSFSPLIGKGVFDALSLDQTLASKGQRGGTSPGQVREALREARESLHLK
jgi:argininosuccinate lyase